MSNSDGVTSALISKAIYLRVQTFKHGALEARCRHAAMGAEEARWRCSDVEVWSVGGALQACRRGSTEVWRSRGSM